MRQCLRLGILFGGRSNEHEISVISAQHVIAACDPERFTVVPIGITTTGAWLTPEETAQRLPLIRSGQLTRLEGAAGESLLTRPQVLAVLRQIDVVFPVMHGLNGEDGTIQGLFELAGVPYVGAGVAASALGMDKALQKQLFRQAGLQVTDYVVVLGSRWRSERREIEQEIERQFSYPVFVKPANSGSSVGVSKVRSREDLGEAIAIALQHDRKVLVERAIEGREIECAVLGNDQPETAPLGEVIPDREFYDYQSKYSPDSKSQFVTPADLPEETADTIKKMAILAYKTIDCAGMARVDFFLSRTHGIVVNEINTIPGFTPISGYPKMWQAAGLSYQDLISRLVDLALERHREKQGYGEGVYTP